MLNSFSYLHICCLFLWFVCSRACLPCVLLLRPSRRCVTLYRWFIYYYCVFSFIKKKYVGRLSTTVDYKTYCSRLFASSFSSAAIWFAFSLILILQFLYYIRTHTHTHNERCVYTYLLYMHCVTYFDALQRNQFSYSHNSCPTWKDFRCAAPCRLIRQQMWYRKRGRRKGKRNE